MPFPKPFHVIAAIGLLAVAVVAQDPKPAARSNAQPEKPAAAEEQIDFAKARQLFQKKNSGGKLTEEEEVYLKRALELRQRTQGRPRPAGAEGDSRAVFGKESIGVKPLSDMTADDRYEKQDGGLYGGGHNTPQGKLLEQALAETSKIQPLDASGKPSADGKIVLVSISMSNATQEFSRFKQIADNDPAKSRLLTIVDCAQGGQAMAEWAPADARPWEEAERRIRASGVTPEQVQVAWVKLANKSPRGTLEEHGKKLQSDTTAVLQNAKARFPNLRIAYLGSRTYGGYTQGSLNPEPYAYESAYVCRWLIQAQQQGGKELNFDPANGEVKTPLVLWGAYFWGDGVNARKSDGLVWNRDDFQGDGTHPSLSGREKVARLLLNFFKTDPQAKTWFVGK